MTVQLLSEPPLDEAALNVSQLRIQEPAISLHICLARPPEMSSRARGLH
jgi:hypothetical protein